MRAAGSALAAALLAALALDAGPALAAGVLALQTDPPGADVSLDGRMIGSTPLHRTLPAGQYILGVAAPGRRAVQTYVMVVDGLVTRRHLVLAGGPDQATLARRAAEARAAARARAEVARENARRAARLQREREREALAWAAAQRREQEAAARQEAARQEAAAAKAAEAVQAAARERAAAARLAAAKARAESKEQGVVARREALRTAAAEAAARRAERRAAAERAARAAAAEALAGAVAPPDQGPPGRTGHIVGSNAATEDVAPVSGTSPQPGAPRSPAELLLALGVGLLVLALGLLPEPQATGPAGPRSARLDDPDLADAVRDEDWDEVAELVEANLRRGGLTHEGLYHLGLARQRQQRPIEAEAAYRAALQHDPRDRRAALNLALALEAQRDPARALIAYRELTARHPRFAPGWVNLAKLLTATGQRRAADRAWRSAWWAAPADPGLAGAALRSLAAWARRPGRTPRPQDPTRTATHPARAA